MRRVTLHLLETISFFLIWFGTTYIAISLVLAQKGNYNIFEGIFAMISIIDGIILRLICNIKLD